MKLSRTGFFTLYAKEPVRNTQETCVSMQVTGPVTGCSAAKAAGSCIAMAKAACAAGSSSEQWD